MNALLTQIDLLRRRRNVLVMATSNLTNAIGAHGPHGDRGRGPRTLMEAGWSPVDTQARGGTDDAFLDRADIKQFIGLPTRLAVYQILRTCVHELMRVGIVTPAVWGPVRSYSHRAAALQKLEG